MRKNIIRIAIVAAIILLVLLAGTLFTEEVQWNEAVAYGGILLAIAGLYELWQWLKTGSGVYRLAFGVGLAGLLLLGLVSGAVGIIGSENNPANLMYFAVPTVGLIGAIIVRFKPRGMSCALFAVAFIQFLVPVVALLIWPAKASWGDAGVVGVFIMNLVFVGIFVVSALLFRRVARTV